LQSKKIIFSIYILIILLLVLLPINGKGSKINHTYILTLRLDYIFHTFLFLPWMFLNPMKTIQIKTKAWLIVGLLFASFTECIQYVVPYRAFNVNDMLANSMGVIFSAVFIYFIIRNQKIESTFNR